MIEMLHSTVDFQCNITCYTFSYSLVFVNLVYVLAEGRLKELQWVTCLAQFGLLAYWEIQCFRKYFLVICEVNRRCRCSSVRKPASLPTSVVQLQEESLCKYTHNNFTVMTGLNTNLAWKQRQQTSRILVGGGHLWAMISSVWQITAKKIWIQSMICLHLFFFYPLATAVLTWAQPICLRQQELKLPTKPIWKGPTMSSITYCVRAAEGIQRSVSDIKIWITSALHVQTLENTATFAPNILAWETGLEDAPVTWINTAMSPLSSSLFSFLTPTETVVISDFPFLSCGSSFGFCQQSTNFVWFWFGYFYQRLV